MAQVRICMSCGTAWQAGSMAAVDGFCLQCPGELGPPVEAGSAQAQAAIRAGQAAAGTQSLPPADSGMALAINTTIAPVASQPRESGTTTAALNMPGPRTSGSTTAALRGAADDLEPPPPSRGSAALTKIRYSPEPLAPGQTIRRQAQAVTPEEVEVNIDPLTAMGTAATGGQGSSRRHPEAGSGDTTAVVLTDGNGQPLAPAGPAVKQSAIGRIAGVTSGLPAKLARLSWHCRDCQVGYPAGSPRIGGKVCGECGGKLEPELLAVAPGVPCLLLYDPDTRVRVARFALQQDVFLIGRLDPGSETFPDLNVSDYLPAVDARQVSRRQCEVQRDRNAVPEAYYLAPQAGNSGVYVKGNLIEPGQRVKLEADLLFGLGGDRIFLRFEENRAP